MIILLFFLFPVFGIAQVDIIGYIESEYDHLQLQENNYNFGYNKLRLDLESRPNENVFIHSNVNFQLFHGKTTWDFFDFLPMDTVIISEDTITTMYESYSNEIYLDNIYLRTSFSKCDLTIGRQPLSLGTGYAWNPLDIFNQKKLVDPTYEQPGINALRMEIPLMARTLLDAIITPDSTWEMSTVMIQLKTGLGSFDISLNGAKQYHLIPDTETGYTYDEVYFGGGSFVGEIWEFGLWGETLSSLDFNNNFGEVVLGVDHTLKNGFYLMCEYLHNSLGADQENLEFEHHSHYYHGETHSLMQNYIFAMGMYSFTNYISGSMLAFGNIDDQSFILAPQIDWDVFEDVSFNMLASHSFGEKKSEFGIQKRTIRFRIRAYF